LEPSKHDLINLDHAERFSFIADLCFKLIDIGRVKELAVGWLVDYLHNYRMGRVDIVRTKIEDFFINSLDEDVELAVLGMLNSKKITVRESASDICGQKKVFKAIPRLTDMLSNETNPHVIRSCITALTRLNATESSSQIFTWMKNNQDKWGEQAVSASLMNIAVSALKELDKNGNYLKQMMTLSER